jgi:hypothetical protein
LYNCSRSSLHKLHNHERFFYSQKTNSSMHSILTRQSTTFTIIFRKRPGQDKELHCWKTIVSSAHPVLIAASMPVFRASGVHCWYPPYLIMEGILPNLLIPPTELPCLRQLI